MADLGFLSTIGVTVGQTLPFPLSIPQTHPVSYSQSAQGQSDVIVINNLSPCTFRVTLNPTGRSFTLPAGVPTQPLPLGLRGVYDDSVSLLVEGISSGAFANQVHFDWFSANEPVLYVASNSSSTGSISLTAITASSLTLPSPDNWIIQEDGSGNLTFTDTTTGASFDMLRSDGFQANVNSGSGNPEILVANDSADSQQWALLKTSSTFNVSIPEENSALLVYDITNAANVMYFGKGGNGVGLPQGVFSIGGQLTAGNFGLPSIVAQAIAVHVTSTSTQTILSFSVPATGLYMATMYFWFGNTSPEKVDAHVFWTDPTGSAPTDGWFVSTGGSPSPNIALNGASMAAAIGINQAIACQPITVYAKASTNIQISYTDGAGSPSDTITAMILRLA